MPPCLSQSTVARRRDDRAVPAPHGLLVPLSRHGQESLRLRLCGVPYEQQGGEAKSDVRQEHNPHSLHYRASA